MAGSYVSLAMEAQGFLGLRSYLDDEEVSKTSTVSSYDLFLLSLCNCLFQYLEMVNLVLEKSILLFSRGQAKESEEMAR